MDDNRAEWLARTDELLGSLENLALQDTYLLRQPLRNELAALLEERPGWGHLEPPRTVVAAIDYVFLLQGGGDDGDPYDPRRPPSGRTQRRAVRAALSEPASVQFP